MKTILMTLFLASSVLHADMDCSSIKGIADEILRAQTEGANISAKYKTCLNQKNYKYIKVDNPRKLIEEGPQCLLSEGDTAVIKKVKKVDLLRYEVEYEVKVSTPCDGKTKFRDKFDFVLSTKGNQRDYKSCASMIQQPAYNIVRAACAVNN